MGVSEGGGANVTPGGSRLDIFFGIAPPPRVEERGERGERGEIRFRLRLRLRLRLGLSTDDDDFTAACSRRADRLRTIDD